MFTVDATFEAFERAAAQLAVSLDSHVRNGFDLTLEQIAVTAKQTTTFVDRTGALRNSIMSDGVHGNDPMVGIVSFAATSDRGFLYGLAQEFGSRNGVREKRFIRDAIDAADGSLIESAMARAFRDAGFEVSR